MDYYHYHADVLELLVDGLSRLFKSKQALIDFFRGAGVRARFLEQLAESVRIDRGSFKKHEIVRRVLTNLNEAGDAALAPRREIVKRIVEHEDFSSAWPADQNAAKAFVADLRRLVGAKDAVTRVEDARREERHKHMALQDEANARTAARRADYQELRERLFALFGEKDPWARGKLLEAVFNGLCALHGIQVRQAFCLRGDKQKGVVEQLDGVICIDGVVYLVELKWHASNIGPDVLAQHWMRVASRDGARGILISASEFTDAAVAQTRENLALKTFILVPLNDIIQALYQDKCLIEFLRRRVYAAISEKNPCCSVDIASLPRFS